MTDVKTDIFFNWLCYCLVNIHLSKLVSLEGVDSRTFSGEDSASDEFNFCGFGWLSLRPIKWLRKSCGWHWGFYGGLVSPAADLWGFCGLLILILNHILKSFYYQWITSQLCKNLNYYLFSKDFSEEKNNKKKDWFLQSFS